MNNDIRLDQDVIDLINIYIVSQRDKGRNIDFTTAMNEIVRNSEMYRHCVEESNELLLDLFKFVTNYLRSSFNTMGRRVKSVTGKNPIVSKDKIS